MGASRGGRRKYYGDKMPPVWQLTSGKSMARGSSKTPRCAELVSITEKSIGQKRALGKELSLFETLFI